VRVVVFGGLAATAPALWMARNVAAGSDAMGPRADASATLVGNVRRVANEASQWVGTQLAPPPLRAVALAVLLLALGVLVVALARDRTKVPSDWFAMFPLALLIVVYVGYLVASASIVAFGAINTRFLVPVFVPVVVVGAWIFERVRGRIGSETARTVLTSLAVVWVVVNVLWFAGRAISYAQNGAGGYSSERWHPSALIQDVKRLDLAPNVYSNDARAIAIFADKSVPVGVAKTFFNSDSKTRDLPAFVHQVECRGDTQLIWFVPNGAKYLYTLDELREHVRLVPVVERSDGVIYDVRPLPGRRCRP
jgi:hypothetical protein